MPLVKAKQAQAHHQSAIVMDLSDLERQAERIIGDARARGQQIVDDAHKIAAEEAKRIKEEARKGGHAEGFAAGESLGHQAGHDEAVKNVARALADLTGRWAQLLEIIEQNLPTHMADAKVDLIRLALAIAAKVTRQEPVKNRKVAEQTVAAALALVGAGRTVALHVHPDELETIEAYLPEILAKLRTVKGVEVKADESVTHGGCVARFGAGEVDARLETQIQRIADELLSAST